VAVVFGVPGQQVIDNVEARRERMAPGKG
jgi:hypothetical protein